MSYAIKNGQTSVVLRFKLLDSSSTIGAGLTGLTSASSGLRISTIADNEASATAYTVAGSTIEAVTTLGTYAAPTATKCRFKEVDATSHPGLYEFQFADARFAVSSAKSLIISVSGATNQAQADFIVPLVVDDPYTAKLTDKTGYSLSQTFPSNFSSLAITGGGAVTAGTVSDKTGYSLTQSFPTNFSSLSIDASGRIDIGKALGTAVTLDANNVLNVSTKYVGGTLQTARDIGTSVLISSGTGTGQLDVTSGVIKANLAQILGTALTETAGQIAAAFKKFFNIATPASTMDALTLVATATNLTNAPTSGDFTSTMKTSITTAATAATPTAAAVTGNVGGNVTGSVGSISGVTFPTRFSSLAIDVSGNVTFGNTSIATVTNLTNAPTSGDFTATMKTSLNNATPAVTVSDKTGFSLTAAYDLAKTAAQTGDAMTLTSAYDAAKSAASQSSVDALPTTSTVMSADIKKVNGVTVNGDGSGTPWGP